MPHFFAPPPPGTKLGEIDADYFLGDLRTISDMVQRAQRVNNIEESAWRWYDMWMDGPATRLFVAFIEAHKQSIERHKRDFQPIPGELTSSWSGMSITTCFYLSSVLRSVLNTEINPYQVMWSLDLPFELQIQRHLLRVLCGDLERTKHVMAEPDTRNCDLWFWKAFVCAFAIIQAQTGSESPGRASQAIFKVYGKYIREWVDATGITTWPNAKRVLQRIVWPDPSFNDSLAQNVWEQAVSGG